jgi:cation diffusion facilitator CzcD-associated flavoprotein CzcO
MADLPTVCVIGAGSSGIAAARTLHAQGFDFDVYEASDRVGGNWVFRNRNGMSSSDATLHINTSRERMESPDFPMPRSYPDFPHHTHIARYFDDYVDHFGFRDRIRFETAVQRAERAPGGGWDVTAGGATRHYDALIVANGHHCDPRWPEPPFPGSDSFAGERIHSHSYTDPDQLRDRDVVVLGMGNSAMDIAVDASYAARSTYLAARRGGHVIPKSIWGRPIDQLGASPRIQFAARRALIAGMLRVYQGEMERFGLPRPDHRFGDAHPTVSGRILDRLSHGAITLFRRVFHPDIAGVDFVGLLQPLGAIMPLADAQARWVADHLAGRHALPPRAEMPADMDAERRRMFKRYVASKRHTMQVDFEDYLVALDKERRAGERRARAAWPVAA